MGLLVLLALAKQCPEAQITTVEYIDREAPAPEGEKVDYVRGTYKGMGSTAKEVRRAVLKVAKELYRGSAADVLQLIYLDSLSYDKERKAGGCNGSIRFAEELKAAGREDLQSAVADITKVQAAASKLLNCEAPVSWADTMVLVGYGAITSLLVDSISSGAKSERGKLSSRSTYCRAGVEASSSHNFSLPSATSRRQCRWQASSSGR